MRWLDTNGVQIELRWILARCGIPGNERVDELAKEASPSLACGLTPLISILCSQPRSSDESKGR